VGLLPFVVCSVAEYDKRLVARLGLSFAVVSFRSAGTYNYLLTYILSKTASKIKFNKYNICVLIIKNIAFCHKIIISCKIYLEYLKIYVC